MCCFTILHIICDYFINSYAVYWYMYRHPCIFVIIVLFGKSYWLLFSCHFKSKIYYFSHFVPHIFYYHFRWCVIDKDFELRKWRHPVNYIIFCVSCFRISITCFIQICLWSSKKLTSSQKSHSLTPALRFTQ